MKNRQNETGRSVTCLDRTLKSMGAEVGGGGERFKLLLTLNANLISLHISLHRERPCLHFSRIILVILNWREIKSKSMEIWEFIVIFFSFSEIFKKGINIDLKKYKRKRETFQQWDRTVPLMCFVQRFAFNSPWYLFFIKTKYLCFSFSFFF